MARIEQIVKGWMQDEEGATMVEYGLMLALIAAVCVGLVVTLGTKIATAFSNVNSAIK